MADDRRQMGEPDPGGFSGIDRYEIQHLAEKHRISTGEARDLIERFGHNPEILDRQAAKLLRQ